MKKKQCKQCSKILSIYNKGIYCFTHQRDRIFEQATKSFDTHNFSPERWHRERDFTKT